MSHGVLKISGSGLHEHGWRWPNFLWKISRFGLHKDSWKCPYVFLEIYGFDHLKHGRRWPDFPRKISGFGLHKHGWKCPQVFFFQKRLVLSPQTWLEIAWHSVNNIWLWSPQRQVSLKKYVFDHLKHGWRWSAFPRKIYRFCAHKNSWKLSWSLLKYSRFWSPQTLLEMSLGPLKAHLVLSPQTRLEMSTGDHHKHGDGQTSHEKHPVLVATKTAGNVQRCPLKKHFFFSHEHRWRWPNFLWTISHSLKIWRRLEKR